MTNQNLIDALKEPEVEKPVKALYDLYFENIIAQIVANGGTREDGSDVFQDAIIILIEKVRMNHFRGESSIKTFLSAIARNLWLFELRTRDRRKKREKFYADSSDKIILENEHFMDRSDRQSLEQIFDQIGATCKRILTGVYFENRSMKELLGEFDFENEQVLRNKKSKCMKKVKEMLLNNTALMENLKPLSLYE